MNVDHCDLHLFRGQPLGHSYNPYIQHPLTLCIMQHSSRCKIKSLDCEIQVTVTNIYFEFKLRAKLKYISESMVFIQEIIFKIKNKLLNHEL